MLSSWLYNLILGAVKGKIGTKICDAAKTGVSTVISTTLADALKQLSLDIVVPLPPQLQRPGFALSVDLRLTGPPAITQSSLAVPIAAQCHNPLRPATTPLKAPSIPTFAESAAHMLSAEVDTWSGERALAVFQQGGFLRYTIEPSLIPGKQPSPNPHPILTSSSPIITSSSPDRVTASAGISLNTDFFKVFAPDVFKQYPEMPMSVHKQSAAECDLWVYSDDRLLVISGRSSRT